MTGVTRTMTVGELSRRTGVSNKALRDYTDWGLINTLGRSGANYRLYDEQALHCVHLIAEMRGLGLTLAEIRALARSYPDENGQFVGPRLAQRLRTARARVEAQIACLEQTRSRIDAFESTHRALLGGRCGSDARRLEGEACACA
ncbi:MerR family transcriptional regulator [Jatrophihabitans cynanchi]|jgi:DNA-binding transcriptional MerR regulator|uniref:MerR family transcriptional regulator n=1 Tax=Jatrophihabitans cynanchi TaxID=2944128 RepID=A0ABY7K5N3_9ACTN|nr:MerR family transcriptional regulator [Jatrophihabitans sp. SB3-54]WAX59173.1 MerR family transcriptional regulator [Jatrophihabitans sp. SB3-54]